MPSPVPGTATQGGPVLGLHEVVFAVSRGTGSCRRPASAAGHRARPARCLVPRPRSSARRRATEPIRCWSSAATRTSSSTCRRSAASRSAVTRSWGGPSSTWIQDSVCSSAVAAGSLVAADAEDPAQPAGHVPAHPQQRVHDQQDLGLVPVQFGGDRVDQVGHVVGDDVHHQARPAHRVQVRAVGLADLDQGPALRPAQAEPGVRFGDRRQPRRRGQVLGGDALVVGAQVAGNAVAAAPVAQRAGVQGGIVLPRLVRLGQQGVPGLIRVTVRHRVHSFVSTNLIPVLPHPDSLQPRENSATPL